jgi:hypothetical protein
MPSLVRTLAVTGKDTEFTVSEQKGKWDLSDTFYLYMQIQGSF